MFYRRRNSKYGARKCAYAGVLYHSKAEAEYAMNLDLLARGKMIAGWERQIRIPLIVNGVKVSTYVMDFKITHNNGLVEMVEVKGYPTAVWKLKRKLFEATYLKEHPEVKYTIEMVG